MAKLKHYTLLFFFVLACLKSKTASAIAPEPTVPTDTMIAIPGTCNQIDLSFVAGNGSRRIVVGSRGVPVNAFPIDGISYIGGSVYGTGSNLGNGNFVVYSSTGSSTTISGLAGGYQYFFSVFEYNGTGFNTNYLLTNYPSADAVALGFTMTLTATATAICFGSSTTLQVTGGNTYSWTPSATLSSSTDSVVTATPSSTIQYTVNGMDNDGCADVKSIQITVNQLPTVTVPNYNNLCDNQGNFTLNGGSPSGGTYFVDGSQSAVINPATIGEGAHEILYSYTNSSGCTSSDTSAIQVVAAPVASFASLSPLCINASPVVLNGGAPSGGVYSGSGVISGSFNPATAGTGTHVLSYIVTQNNCSDTATISAVVNPLPVVSMSLPAATCLNSGVINLTQGNPVSGIYSGVGVNANQFDPAAAGIGTHVITYTYTNANGCRAADSAEILVNGIPTVTFASLTDVCANTGPVTLNGGSPSGGVFLGPAVSGNRFFTGIAGAGQFILQYRFTDGNGCTSSDTSGITVHPIPTVTLGADVTICQDERVILTGGFTFETYHWSNGANTSAIVVDSTGIGIGSRQFILTVTNAFSCVNRDTIVVTVDVCTIVPSLNTISDFSIYPNPATEAFIFKSEKTMYLRIFDQSGRLVEDLGNQQSIRFGSTLSAGIYFIHITNGEGQKWVKIIRD